MINYDLGCIERGEKVDGNTTASASNTYYSIGTQIPTGRQLTGISSANPSVSLDYTNRVAAYIISGSSGASGIVNLSISNLVPWFKYVVDVIHPPNTELTLRFPSGTNQAFEFGRDVSGSVSGKRDRIYFEYSPEDGIHIAGVNPIIG